MHPCVLCGVRFDDEDGKYTVCGNCWDAGDVDGSSEQKYLCRLLRQLDDLDLSEDDDMVAANSDVGSRLVYRWLLAMDWKCRQNLLQNVMKHL